MPPLLAVPMPKAAERSVVQAPAVTGAIPDHQAETAEEVMAAEVAEIEIAGLLSVLLDCLVVLQCERSGSG